MSLSLDVYNKRKQEFKRGMAKLDKRKFKGGRSKEDNLIEELKKEMDNLKIINKEEIIRDVIKLKNIKYLNFYLLLNVYLYFASKNFDLGTVFMNFDEDFNKEMNRIKTENNPYTADLNDLFNLHKFRQDYIIYLFLLEELELSNTGGEYYEEDSYLVEKEDYEGAVDFEDDNYLEDEYQQDY